MIFYYVLNSNIQQQKPIFFLCYFQMKNALDINKLENRKKQYHFQLETIRQSGIFINK